MERDIGGPMSPSSPGRILTLCGSSPFCGVLSRTGPAKSIHRHSTVLSHNSRRADVGAARVYVGVLRLSCGDSRATLLLKKPTITLCLLFLAGDWWETLLCVGDGPTAAIRRGHTGRGASGRPSGGSRMRRGRTPGRLGGTPWKQGKGEAVDGGGTRANWRIYKKQRSTNRAEFVGGTAVQRASWILGLYWVVCFMNRLGIPVQALAV